MYTALVSMFSRIYLIVVVALPLVAMYPTPSRAASERAAAPAKLRIVVMTDIGGDPDDQQSLVRFLLYSCDFEVEAICAGLGHGHKEQTRPGLVREGVKEYGKVVANLRKHNPDYPSEERLMGLIKPGYNDQMHSIGAGKDSEASEWIIKVLDRDDPRPVWFTVWGGPRDLAQAIWKVQTTRTPAQLAAFKRKILVYSTGDQDNTAVWVKKNHPEIPWIYSKIHRGMFADGDQKIVSLEWLTKNVRTGHGALGATYPPKAAGGPRVVEGDTPSFLYLLPNGLSDPAHPEWGSWGGRFAPVGEGAEYRGAPDMYHGKPDPEYTIRRWRLAYQNAFEARMDWCVKPVDQANHTPTAICHSCPR